MKRIPFDELAAAFSRALLKRSFSAEMAGFCARIFAENSRDGVHSHGLNRFPAFIRQIEKGFVQPHAKPETTETTGVIETWDGHQAPGMYTATLAMQRAMEIAKEKGMGCVTVRNTSHWMRGGTYGWQAAEHGFIGICFTNAVASMPAWGAKEASLGNNPLVIAVPRSSGHIVLDMAMSQYSYGKMQEYRMAGKKLPYPGGYDEHNGLSDDPVAIMQTKRALPIGFWKGSGLSLLLDILLVALSGGRSVAEITKAGEEYAVSQCFIAIHRPDLHERLVEQILDYTKGGEPAVPGGKISYPGENTLRIRRESEKLGVEVNEELWEQVQSFG